MAYVNAVRLYFEIEEEEEVIIRPMPCYIR